MILSIRISASTRGHGDVVDLTPQVSRVVSESRVGNGIAAVFAIGSTAGITTIEYEPGLVADLQEAFERLAKEGISYHHDLRWGDGNGHSHVRASLLGPSLTVPIEAGRLGLGTWQQIVLVDFDTRPRQREVLVQVMGE